MGGAHGAANTEKGKIVSKSAKTLDERVADADARGGNYLARANEYAERGDKEKAEKLYEKCQYWLDRSNKLRGCS